MSEIYIAIDFDGTIVTHEFPHIGEPVPGAVSTIKVLKERGCVLILWTMRSGRPLDNAVEYCKSQGIEFDHINQNPQPWTDSPKAYAQQYIDDAAVGCPLIWPNAGRPYVDWGGIRRLMGIRSDE